MARVYAREIADNRGRRQNDVLEDVYRRIYARRPAPTPQIEAARDLFLRQALAHADAHSRRREETVEAA